MSSKHPIIAALDDQDISRLSPRNAPAQMSALWRDISLCDRAYYQDDDPLVDDAVYDALRRNWNIWVEKFPAIARAIRSDDPVVGVTPITVLDNKAAHSGQALPLGFAKFRHSEPMLSLDNAFTKHDIEKFVERCCDFLKSAPEDLACYVEPKIDGLAVSLLYENGRLVSAATRGDGTLGEDISKNFAFVQGVPTEIDASAIIVVRGEVYMAYQDFLDLNQTQEKKGEKIFANPRNAAAGSLRQIDARVTAQRCLRMMAYGIDRCSIGNTVKVKTRQDLSRQFKDWGFATADEHARLCASVQDIEDHYQKIISERSSLGYDIDGLVVVMNNLDFQRRLGKTERAPRWAIAWKFPASSAQTTLRAITVQVGRTGALTPVAELDPVTIGGVSVRRASLHNEDELMRLGLNRESLQSVAHRLEGIYFNDHGLADIGVGAALEVKQAGFNFQTISSLGLGIGDKVEVKRSGDVIPKVVARIGPPQSSPFIFPKNCPACGTKTVRPMGAAVRRCPNRWQCKAQILGFLTHFVSRRAFNIDGLGPKQLTDFWQRGWLQSPADIFRLERHTDNLQKEDGNGWEKKSITNLLKAVEACRNIDLDRFIYALAIPQIGQTTTRHLAQYFGSWPAFYHSLTLTQGNDTQAIEEQKKWLELDGIGQGALGQLQHFITGEHYRVMVADLLNEVTPRDADEPVKTAFSGKSVVFTGKLVKFSRDEAKERAGFLGLRVAASVSSNVDWVVAGDKPGSKAKKAQELGITILDEQDWLDLTETR